MSTPLTADLTEVFFPALIDQMERIATALEALLAAQAPATPPDYVRNITDFATFDWSTIGAYVIESDQYGPTLVEHKGKTFKRRSPENKFGAAIWFSRAAGKDEDGSNLYERLITFKEFTPAEPLSRGAEAKAGAPRPAAPAPATQPNPASTGNGKPPARPAQPPEPPPWDEFEDEFERMPPAAQEPAQAAALARAKAAEEERAAKAAFLAQQAAKPKTIDHEILASIGQLDKIKGASGFTGPASPEQWGLLKGLLEKAMGDKTDRNIVLARLAGVEVKTVENPDWRPPKARAAAIIDWLVAKQPNGEAIRPLTVAEGRGIDLATVMQGAWGALAADNASTEDVAY